MPHFTHPSPSTPTHTHTHTYNAPSHTHRGPDTRACQPLAMSHSMSIPTANGAPHFDKARNNFGRPLGHYKSITKGFPLLSSFRLAAPSSCRWKDRLDACMENHVMQATRLPARDRGLVFFFLSSSSIPRAPSARHGMRHNSSNTTTVPVPPTPPPLHACPSVVKVEQS